MSHRIWLIGGTSESAQLAQLMTERAVPFVVTVTTAAAKRLYPACVQVCVGALNAQSVPTFIKEWQVRGILDASHPFACEISQLAIDVAQSQSIAYLRYERPTVSSAPQDTVHHAKSQDYFEHQSSVHQASVHGEKHPHTGAISLPNFLNTTECERQGAVILVKSIPNLLESDILRGQRVLFTLGYRYLSLFSDLRPDSQLFARILPSVEAISGAIAAGFSPQEIVALRPPVSAALESALWQQWNITRVVAKASGKPGGEATKRAVAAELGIPLILLERPQMTYSRKTIDGSKAIEFCIKTLTVYYPSA